MTAPNPMRTPIPWTPEAWAALGYHIPPVGPYQRQPAIIKFLTDSCDCGPGLLVTSVDLFNAWLLWLQPYSQIHGELIGFSKQLRSAIPGLKGSQKRLPHGVRVRYLRDIGVRVPTSDNP